MADTDVVGGAGYPGGVTEEATLLGPAQVRDLAERLRLRPTKSRGQNFVVDANTVRRISRLAGLTPEDVVVEVGPGLGSLTLALLPLARRVVAIEIDDVLATELPRTVARCAPAYADRLHVIHADALTVGEIPGPAPTALVANLPYNVSVPVLLTFLRDLPSLRTVLVMVQLEVAERLAARPGSKAYGVPSVKAAWYGDVRLVGTVSRHVFWPVPRVDSGLVALTRREPPGVAPLAAAAVEGVARGADDRVGHATGHATGDTVGHADCRDEVFGCVDAAFAQRRKTLRAALAGWAGGAERAEMVLLEAGVDPRARGEQLAVSDFAAIVAARGRLPGASEEPMTFGHNAPRIGREC